jgi:nitroreductase
MKRSSDVPDAMTVIRSRKSVRSFTGEAVSQEELDEILRAAMSAPSAVGKSPWAFVVVTDRATLDLLREGLPYAKMLDKAGAAIVVCGLPEKAYLQKVEYAVIDGTCASENILLAVEALGLGAVWTAAYPYEDRAAHVRKVLGIPGNVIPLNVIPIGHPTGADKPKDHFRAENIHREKW